MKTLLLFLLFSISLFAEVNSYTASYTSTLSGTSDSLTIQFLSGGGKDAHGVTGWVRCSAACSFSLVQNGTAATTTTLATAALNGAPPSQAVAFSASNVGAGTTIATYYLEAAGTYPFDLTRFFLTHGPVSNITIKIATFTGSWTPTIQFTEE